MGWGRDLLLLIFWSNICFVIVALPANFNEISGSKEDQSFPSGNMESGVTSQEESGEENGLADKEVKLRTSDHHAVEDNNELRDTSNEYEPEVAKPAVVGGETFYSSFKKQFKQGDEGRMTKKDCTDYLVRFGYLEEDDMESEELREEALITFQEFFGLPVSGKCSNETKFMMSLLRCGVKDIRPHIKLGKRVRRYAIEGDTWHRKNDLTYIVLNGPPGPPGSTLTLEDTKTEMKKALKVWSDVTPLCFYEVQDPNDADMIIFFASGDHSAVSGHPDDPPFIINGTVLAHAFQPVNRGSTPLEGDVHFDASRNWAQSASDGISLCLVAAHEIGHALGLYHTDVVGSLMQAIYNPALSCALHADDTAAIQALYGNKDGSKDHNVRISNLIVKLSGVATVTLDEKKLCPEVIYPVLLAENIFPVTCSNTSVEETDNGFTIDLELDVDVTKAALDSGLTSQSFNDIISPSKLNSIPGTGVTISSSNVPSTSACSDAQQELCGRGGAQHVSFGSGCYCLCPDNLMNVDTIPELICSRGEKERVSYANVRNVLLSISLDVSALTDATFGELFFAMGDILDKRKIFLAGLQFISAIETVVTVQMALRTWIAFTNEDLNDALPLKDLQEAVPQLDITGREFQETDPMCSDPQANECSAGTDCKPYSGGFYCDCPMGSVNVGNFENVDCVTVEAKTTEATTMMTEPETTTTTIMTEPETTTTTIMTEPETTTTTIMTEPQTTTTTIMTEPETTTTTIMTEPETTTTTIMTEPETTTTTIMTEPQTTTTTIMTEPETTTTTIMTEPETTTTTTMTEPQTTTTTMMTEPETTTTTIMTEPETTTTTMMTEPQTTTTTMMTEPETTTTTIMTEPETTTTTIMTEPETTTTTTMTEPETTTTTMMTEQETTTTTIMTEPQTTTTTIMTEPETTTTTIMTEPEATTTTIMTETETATTTMMTETETTTTTMMTEPETTTTTTMTEPETTTTTMMTEQETTTTTTVTEPETTTTTIMTEPETTTTTMMTEPETTTTTTMTEPETTTTTMMTEQETTTTTMTEPETTTTTIMTEPETTTTTIMTEPQTTTTTIMTEPQTTTTTIMTEPETTTTTTMTDPEMTTTTTMTDPETTTTTMTEPETTTTTMTEPVSDSGTGVFANFVGLLLSIVADFTSDFTSEPDNLELELELCSGITSVLALSSITVVDCALVNNTGNTSVIMLDLFSSVPLTPTDVESLLTSESLQNEINLTISDVFFAGTDSECGPDYKDECTTPSSECEPILGGFQCLCTPGTINMGNSTHLDCQTLTEPTTTTTVTSTTTVEPTPESLTTFRIVLGLVVGGVSLLLLVIILAFLRKFTTLLGTPTKPPLDSPLDFTADLPPSQWYGPGLPPPQWYRPAPPFATRATPGYGQSPLRYNY